MRTGFDFYRFVVKPFFDFAFALVFSILLAPLLLAISFLLLIHFNGSPLYVQQRVGLHEKVFYLYKFRSFKVEGDKSSVTWIGRALRSTSLDELPQIINIMRGEMSWVGPRPLLPEYLPYYSKEEQSRHQVKPGISGLSQVEIGNSSNWDDRLSKDSTYVASQSFLLDISFHHFYFHHLFLHTHIVESFAEFFMILS